jgi:hypothetical protein
MQIVESDEQIQKAEDPIDERFEPDSNATKTSELHSEKHWSHKFATDEGRQIAERDEQFEKAKLSIDESLESDANVTVKRERHPVKLFSSTFSSERGRQIVLSPKQ